jgi:hypothetical protein
MEKRLCHLGGPHQAGHDNSMGSYEELRDFAAPRENLLLRVDVAPLTGFGEFELGQLVGDVAQFP